MTTKAKLISLFLENLNLDVPFWKVSHCKGLPKNPVNKKCYNGINSLLLNGLSQKHAYRSNYWGTPAQWRSLGIQQEKGALGSPVIFLEGKSLNHYFVYNAEQCFGKDCGKYIILSKKEEDYSLVKKFLKPIKYKITHSAKIDHPKFDRAEDRISLPPKKHFNGDAHYYNSLFHELCHWSEVRLGWEGDEDKGELIAELFSNYMESKFFLPCDKDLTNHIYWKETWIKKIVKNPNYLFSSASHVSKIITFFENLSKVE